jgi:hypothetical protein
MRGCGPPARPRLEWRSLGVRYQLIIIICVERRGSASGEHDYPVDLSSAKQSVLPLAQGAPCPPRACSSIVLGKVVGCR